MFIVDNAMRREQLKLAKHSRDLAKIIISHSTQAMVIRISVTTSLPKRIYITNNSQIYENRLRQILVGHMISLPVYIRLSNFVFKNGREKFQH